MQGSRLKTEDEDNNLLGSHGGGVYPWELWMKMSCLSECLGMTEKETLLQESGVAPTLSVLSPGVCFTQLARTRLTTLRARETRGREDHYVARRTQTGLLVRNEVFTRLLISNSYSGAFFHELFLTITFVL